MGGRGSNSNIRKKFTKSEIDAVNFWRGGDSGRGYLAIRALVNGYSVDNERAQKFVADFESAVKKAPSAENKILIRVTGDFRIPGLGKPEIGQEFSINKLESFSATAEKNYDQLVENLGSSDPDQIVFRITGTSNFKDISNIGHGTPGTAIEHEVVTQNKRKYKVVNITPIMTKGRWINEQKYIIVDIEEIRG